VQYVKCDVTSWKEQLALFTKAKQKHGSITLVFANAGIADDNSVFMKILDHEGILKEPKQTVVDVKFKALILSKWQNSPQLPSADTLSIDLPGC
jgi:NAD(P)-dependent dehydrogenase (short-subunit alcohol dehydrogenase family)